MDQTRTDEELAPAPDYDEDDYDENYWERRAEQAMDARFDPF